MRPDQFTARMKIIVQNPNRDEGARDGMMLLLSTFADECPGYWEGIRLFQMYVHLDDPASRAGAA